jgi:hypothetical protein
MATIRLHKRQLPLIEITGSGLYVNSSASQINIGQGNSISVTGSVVNLVTPATLTVDTTNSSSGSHTHQIDASSDPQVNSKILKTDTSGKIRIRQLGVNSPIMPDTHSLEVSGSPNLQFKILYDANNYASLGVNALSDLNIKTLNNVIISPCANIVTDTDEILPNLNYFTNIGDITKKYLSLHVAEIWAETLVAQNTIATIGGRILVAPSNILTQDLSASGSSITVKYNNLFNGDTIYMEGNNQVEWMRITSGSSGTSGSYVYTVTRNLDGSGANNWLAGDSLVNTQKALIDIHSLNRFTGSEVIGGGITGYVRNSNTYNDLKPLWAIGNLQNVYGYGSETYGVAFGKYDDGETWLSMDTTNGFRIVRGASSAEILGQWTKTGSVIIGSTNTNRPYIQIDSNIGMTIFNSGSVLGRWTTTGSVIIGNSMTNNRIQIAPVSGISFYSGNNLRGNFNSVGNFWFGSSFNSARIEYNSTDGLVLYSSTNQNVIQLTTTGSAIIQNKLLLNGTNSAIAIGNPPPTSSTAGTGLWLDRSGLYGLNANVRQAYFGSDGKLYAGGGNVYIDSEGIKIKQGLLIANKLTWVDDIGNEFGHIFMYDGGGFSSFNIQVNTYPLFYAYVTSSIRRIGLNSGLRVGNSDVTGLPHGNLWVEGKSEFRNSVQITSGGLSLSNNGALSTTNYALQLISTNLAINFPNHISLFNRWDTLQIRQAGGGATDITGNMAFMMPLTFGGIRACWFTHGGFVNQSYYDVLDISPNAIPMTGVGGTQELLTFLPSGNLSYEISLNGSTDYFYRTLNAGLEVNNWIAFCAWVRLDSPTRSHGICRAGTTTMMWNLLYNYSGGANGYFEFGAFDTGNTYRVFTQVNSVSGWHCVGIRYGLASSTNFLAQLFLDGTFYNHGLASFSGMRAGAGNFELGRAGSGGTYYLDGIIPVAWFSGSNKEEMMLNYYNMTKAYFISGS